MTTVNTPLKFQIGKQGITEGIIQSLRLAFKNHKQVRISLLKSSGRDDKNKKDMASEIAQRLTDDKFLFTTKVIGFTIILKRKLK